MSGWQRRFLETHHPLPLQATPVITNPFNFRDHTGPNPIGLPTGDLQQVGAFVSPPDGEPLAD